MQVQIPERTFSDAQALSTGKLDLQTQTGGKEITPPADIAQIAPLPDSERAYAVQQDPRKMFDDVQKLTVVVDTLPLPDFVHRIFGDMLQVNYIVDSRVSAKEKVSINLKEPVSRRKLFEIIRDILYGYNVTVREKDGVFSIEPVTDKASLTMGRGYLPEDIPDSPGQIRQIIPLQYANAASMMQILSAVPGVQVFTLPGENALIVTGQRAGIEQVLQFVSVLDRPTMRGRLGVLLRLKYWDPQDLAPKLREVLGTEGLPVAGGANQGGIQLIPFPRWRLLLAFSAEKFWLDRIQYWIQLLDIPKEQDERQYYVFFPENSRALELKATLDSILGLSKATKTGTGARNTPPPMQMNQPAGNIAIEPDKRTVQKEDTSKDSPMADMAQDIRLAVDESRNALIVYARSQPYQMLESLLKQLDIQPPQVLIEATIAEVTLTDDLKYGVEWYLKNTGNNGVGTLQTLGGLGLGAAGLNYSFLANSDKLKVFFNALATNNLVKILSSPQLTVRDGKSASINVGTQVPVVVGETARTTDTSGVVRTYQYRSTGITLNVTPTVHAYDVVTLEIDQDVSEPSSSGGENPIILNRTIQTEVVASNGKTVVIGGLIKDSYGLEETKVPLLGDIPFIGNLFKVTSKGGARVELLVMITPHIIRSTQQIEEMRRDVLRSYQIVEIGENFPAE